MQTIETYGAAALTLLAYGYPKNERANEFLRISRLLENNLRTAHGGAFQQPVRPGRC